MINFVFFGACTEEYKNGVRDRSFLGRNPFRSMILAEGKKFKVALVATMRKIITILNVMVRTKTCWKETDALVQEGEKNA